MWQRGGTVAFFQAHDHIIDKSEFLIRALIQPWKGELVLQDHVDSPSEHVRFCTPRESSFLCQHRPRYLYAIALGVGQGEPVYDVLLQLPDPSTAAAAAAVSATAGNSDPHREESNTQGTAAVDAAVDGRELTALPASDISPLLPFELADGMEDSAQGEGVSQGEVSQVAERLKDRGNTLFKLGDTDAAAEMFARVLRALEPKPVAGRVRQRTG